MATMPKFNNLQELQSLLPELRELPFDDDRVEFDAIADHRVTIKFSGGRRQTKPDDSGRERPVFPALIFDNFHSFEILRPSDGTHFLRSIREAGNNEYRFEMNTAVWLVRFTREISGELCEMMDEGEREFSVSMVSIVLGVVLLGVFGLGLYWLF